MKTGIIISGISLLVFLVWILYSSSLFRTNKGVKTFKIPHGGEITLPGRFFVDSPAPPDDVRSAFLPKDFLLVYGKRSTNMGGYKKVSEALAIGMKTVYPDWDVFRKEAAHFMPDADWRTEAMKV